jgi:hypothetical protein
VQSPDGVPDANGNLIGSGAGIDPRLGPLADNGGPTLTHALLPESRAINAGDPAAMPGVDGAPLNDQRGAPFTRIYDGRIDIGAFERQPTEFILGDFDSDSIVSAADYVLWRKSLGTFGAPAEPVDQRGNADDMVDSWDYNLWRANFGRVHSVAESETAVATSNPLNEGIPLTDQNANHSDSQKLIASTSSPRPTHVPRLRNAEPFVPVRRAALIGWLSAMEDHQSDFPSSTTEVSQPNRTADETPTSLEALDAALAAVPNFRLI